jgi:uncharacterized membrane protein
MTRWLVAVLVGVWLAVAGARVHVHVAEAGPTGASLGGGSWGSPAPSPASSPSSHTSSSSTTFTYTPSSGGTADGLGGLGIVVIALVFVVAMVVGGLRIFFHEVFRGGQENHSNLDAYEDNSKNLTFANYTDVTVLRIGIDARARKLVQSELARIAQVADKTTPEGRATTLREVALLLRRLKDAWVFGGAVNEQMREAKEQALVFAKHVDDAKQRFAGVTTAAGGGGGGDAVILVTLVVAAHSELFEVSHIGDGDDLRLALESASHRTAEDLVAVEMIWVPAGDETPPSSVDVQRAYPAPALIPIANALAGKVFCAFCGGPFAAELVSCPHCGAPAAGARAV